MGKCIFGLGTDFPLYFLPSLPLSLFFSPSVYKRRQGRERRSKTNKGKTIIFWFCLNSTKTTIVTVDCMAFKNCRNILERENLHFSF